MSQSRTHSVLETIANVVIGYVVAIAAQVLIFPLWGIHEALGSQMAIGSMFTVISIIRGYALRRFFNAWRCPSSIPAVTPGCTCFLCNIKPE